MRILMKVLFYISKKKINKHGVAPIYCRITCNGQRSEFSVGIFVPPNQFNNNETLIETTKENILINTQLAKVKSELNILYFELNIKGKYFTANSIKDLYVGGKKEITTFLQLVEDFKNFRLPQIQTYGTLKTVKAKINNCIFHFEQVKKMQLNLQGFDADITKAFYLHLCKKYTNVYARRCLAMLQEMFKYAVKKEYIEKSDVINFKAIYKDEIPKIIYLTPDELKKLISKKYTKSYLEITKDLYTFQSYTGLAFICLMDFDYSRDIMEFKDKKFIYRYRKKGTKGETIVPLFNVAKKILEKYNYKLPRICLQKYNKYIKFIANDLGIEKKLTTHTARKTFGTIKLNEGFSIESVAKMLGHTSIKITQSTYAQVGHTRIYNEMKQVRVK